MSIIKHSASRLGTLLILGAALGLAPGREAAAQNAPCAQLLRVVGVSGADFLSLRPFPTMASQPILGIPPFAVELVDLGQPIGEWVRVRYAHVVGYVHQRHVMAHLLMCVAPPPARPGTVS